MDDQHETRRILDEERFRTVFQPIYGLDTGRVVAVEALTRFTGDAGRSPALGFAQAHAHGVGVELEVAALRRALETAAALPIGVSLSVNLSPEALTDTRVRLTLAERKVPDVTVELTKQVTPTGYPALPRLREHLCEMGVRLAIDDVGVSTASVRDLGWLRPDHVKADISLTRRLESSRGARLLARYLVARARHLRATVVAEGVETPEQLAVWQRTGAGAVQGFLLASPTDLGAALDASVLTSDALGRSAAS